MSTLQETFLEMVRASNTYLLAEDVFANEPNRTTAEAFEAASRSLARAGDAYETALAQFTADVARHAVT